MRVFHSTQHSGYHSTQFSNVLRVATYNIHKGVRGVGPRRRLEIHNLVLGIEALDADFVFLQEVRRMNRAAARHFPDTRFGWPKVPQADYLAPDGYEAAYVTNAVTRDGEHGNALLSRWPIGDVGHHDVSDHRFEQRGLLHVPVMWNGTRVHAIVAHFGLIHASRVRQVQRLGAFIENSGMREGKVLKRDGGSPGTPARARVHSPISSSSLSPQSLKSPATMTASSSGTSRAIKAARRCTWRTRLACIRPKWATMA